MSTRPVSRCHARLGRAALPAFATVAEIESLTGLSARLTEHEAPSKDDAH
jgi:hypothetical protein